MEYVSNDIEIKELDCDPLRSSETKGGVDLPSGSWMPTDFAT